MNRDLSKFRYSLLKKYKRTIRYAIDRLIVRNFALEKENRKTENKVRSSLNTEFLNTEFNS